MLSHERKKDKIKSSCCEGMGLHAAKYATEALTLILAFALISALFAVHVEQAQQTRSHRAKTYSNLTPPPGEIHLTEYVQIKCGTCSTYSIVKTKSLVQLDVEDGSLSHCCGTCSGINRVDLSAVVARYLTTNCTL